MKQRPGFAVPTLSASDDENRKHNNKEKCEAFDDKGGWSGRLSLCFITLPS